MTTGSWKAQERDTIMTCCLSQPLKVNQCESHGDAETKSDEIGDFHGEYCIR